MADIYALPGGFRSQSNPQNRIPIISHLPLAAASDPPRACHNTLENEFCSLSVFIGVHLWPDLLNFAERKSSAQAEGPLCASNMSSTLRIAANRANGAKSRGPVTVAGKLNSLANSARSTGPRTAEGKARSSRNAIRHGILAESIVLANESREAFSGVLSTLQDELQPASPIEHRFVETMAVAEWRRLRLLCLEKEQLAMEIQRQQTADLATVTESGPSESVDTNPIRQTVLAFRSITDHSRVQELINRYESRYDRQYNRALAGLRAHRAEMRKEELIVRRREQAAKAREQKRKQQPAQKDEKLYSPDEVNPT